MPAKSIHAHCCTTMFVSWLNVVGLPAVNQMPTVKERNSFASVLMTQRQLENRDGKTEVDKFLSDLSRNLDSLRKFPTILKLFLRHNTPLPSSASVERLFSLGSQIYLPRRNRPSDSNFERQLLLRVNNFEWLNESFEWTISWSNTISYCLTVNNTGLPERHFNVKCV